MGPDNGSSRWLALVCVVEADVELGVVEGTTDVLTRPKPLKITRS